MDLIYGHLGTPVYDTESQTWNFPRNPHTKRWFHPVSRLFEDKILEKPVSSGAGAQQDLLNAYPEFRGSIFSEDAQFSEIVSNCTSQYDPTVSELLAIGQAADATQSRAILGKLYKIIAVSSGAAGELVRLITLTQQQLKWSKSVSRELNLLTVKNGEEGWWKANGSPIQQLVFAGHENEASTWLAVRYQGAVSILLPTLQLEATCPRNAKGQIRDLPASRLDANHLITLNSQDVGDLPFADVNFNPWDHQQFATIDQGSHWHIWNVKVQVRSQGLWALEKISSGSVAAGEDPGDDFTQFRLDGWAKILWVSDANNVVIANRRKFAMFDLRGEPTSLELPDLGLKNSPDWILDAKRSPVNARHVLIVTSSRLCLLDIRPSRPSEDLHASVVTLISWIHFRSPDDVSLSLSYFDCSEHGDAYRMEKTTSVIVYSRLNSLASVFTFQHSNITGHAVSQGDPCLLPILEKAIFSPQSHPTHTERQSSDGLLCLQMTLVSEKKSRMVQHHDVSEQRDRYFLLTVLHRDRSISEHLYAKSKQKAESLQPPDNQILVGLKKTPYAIVIDDFIVPDIVPEAYQISYTDLGSSHSLHGTESPKQRKMTFAGSDTPIKLIDSRALEMGWLVSLINEKKGFPRSKAFAGCLASVQDAINTKMRSSTPGAETLLELSKADPLITEIDVAATALRSFLEVIPQSPSDATKAAATAPGSRVTVSASLLPTMRVALGFNHDFDLSEVYDNLIKSQIGPLPTKIPDRVRYAMGKQLRTLAAQLCLAASVVRVCEDTPTSNESAEQNISAQDSTFAIPVRRKGPKISKSIRDKEASIRVPYTQPSVPSSGPSSLRLVPTDDSQSSIGSKTLLPSSNRDTSPQSATAESSAAKSSFSEDPSSINLRPLVSLTPQPLLPVKLSNILSHWTVGEDPTSYDWVAAQRATTEPDSAAIAAEQAREEKAARKAKKRARFSAMVGNIDTPDTRTAERVVYSQPEPKRIIETSSQNLMVDSSQVPESSQAGLAIHSQPTTGRFAGRQKGLKAKKDRRSGF